ncbi:MAG: hypothetical protein NC822_06000, partial [Candidatus Omnitrophica bacterium]|nr:hypothetical protein [Candidatus Omnitrophota bacterium]
GVTSGNPISVEGSNVTGGLKTIVASGTGSLSLNPGPNNPSDTNIGNNAQNLVMLQLSLSASSLEDINISSITFTGSGSANEVEDISSVELWLDNNDNGILDGSDTQLNGSLTYSSDNGTVTFNLAPQETILAGTTENWIVVYDLNGNASNSETFQVKLLNNTDVTAQGASSGNPITPTGAPVSGGVMVVSGVPWLSWTGEPNYVSDGLNPEIGTSSTNFTYRVKYTDPNNDPPSYIRVYIDKNGDGDYSDPGEVNNMNEVDPLDTDYTDGKLYTYTTTIPYGPNTDNCSYYFSASDGTYQATGDPTQPINAPDVLATLSITINPNVWAIGVVDANTTTTMSSAQKITVTNDGDTDETFTLLLTDPLGWSSGTNPGNNTYVMSGVFCHATADTPSASDFNESGTEDVITTSTQTATTTKFAYSGGTANGVSVPSSSQRALFLQFKSPTITDQTDEKHIVVTVGCQIP